MHYFVVGFSHLLVINNQSIFDIIFAQLSISTIKKTNKQTVSKRDSR